MTRTPVPLRISSYLYGGYSPYKIRMMIRERIKGFNQFHLLLHNLKRKY